MLGWVTTWGVRCGIATYSDFLSKNLNREVTILAQSDGAPDDDVIRCWQRRNGDFTQLLAKIDELEIKQLVIQHHPGLIVFKDLANLLQSLHQRRIKVSITLHNTRSKPLLFRANRIDKAAKALRNCKNVFVHTQADVNRLSKLGVKDNVHHIPHGIYPPPKEGMKPVLQKKGRTLATFGFMMPHKGQPELIEVFKQLDDWEELWLLCAEVGTSTEVLEKCRKLADERVKIVTDFLDDDVAINTLSQADLVVFPYQSTKESASGALRMAIAAGVPVAVTPLEIFSDVEGAIKLPGRSIHEMKTGISTITAAELQSCKEKITSQRDEQQWSSIAANVERLLRS